VGRAEGAVGADLTAPSTLHEAAINLALQGGGAHGAFTWGVLDALLEDGRIAFDGVSGTSAGAMNAVVLAHGLAVDGRDGARAALEKFWAAVAANAPPHLNAAGAGTDSAFAPLARLMLQWTEHLSPAQMNPFALDPLRDIVNAQIDFERLRAASPVRLFIAATHANSGRLRLFRGSEISADAVLASACLPTLHRAVEIDGEPYWDGAYAANPAVFPLVFDCAARDVLLVLLAPLEYRATPHSAAEIRVRALEIAFNATFLREMRTYAHTRRPPGLFGSLLGRCERRITHTRFHMIETEDRIAALAVDTRIVANLAFLESLKNLGREIAAEWLRRHRGDLGRRSSIDIAQVFR
jgi:NTE family protein